MRALAIRLRPGDDLRRGIEALVGERDLPSACVLSCAGSLTRASLRFAGRPSSSLLDGPWEIVSLSGTLSSGAGSHLHLAVSDAEGRVVGGHLQEGSEVRTTAEVVLGILPDTRFARVHDPRTGCAELVVEPLL
jgi:predicted DNA-binding protein with PD1-like motif